MCAITLGFRTSFTDPVDSTEEFCQSTVQWVSDIVTPDVASSTQLMTSGNLELQNSSVPNYLGPKEP